MKKLILALLFASAILPAQVTLTLTGPATARPGSTVNLALSGNVSATAPVGLEWTISAPAGYTAAATIGAAGTAASKTLYCATGGLLCLAVGMNATPIGTGVVANYAVTVPATAPPGAVTFSLAGLMGADATGSAIAATAGAPYTLMILARSDINGDGKTDATDVTAMINQALGAAACSNDQNGDGKCDVIDAVIVLLKALGQ